MLIVKTMSQGRKGVAVIRLCQRVRLILRKGLFCAANKTVLRLETGCSESSKKPFGVFRHAESVFGTLLSVSCNALCGETRTVFMVFQNVNYLHLKSFQTLNHEALPAAVLISATVAKQHLAGRTATIWRSRCHYTALRLLPIDGKFVTLQRCMPPLWR